MTKISIRRLMVAAATWALAILGAVAVPSLASAEPDEPNSVNYCDYDNDHPGVTSVGSWLASAPPDANTDCIDVGDVVQRCGFVQIPIDSRVIGTTTTPPMDYWIEYVEQNSSDDSVKVMPGTGVSFPEDYNGGSVTIKAYIGGPEQDYVEFANEDAWRYPGQLLVIDTDCEDQVQIDYCDYEANQPATGSVADWLAGAPEGANTDCIDVEEPMIVCGAFDLPIINHVIGMTYRIEYIENGVTKVLPPGGVSWDEDYNGGSVTIQVYVGGPEQDYVDYANVGEWGYPGTQVTVDTDCVAPAPPTVDQPAGDQHVVAAPASTPPPPAKAVPVKAGKLAETGVDTQWAVTIAVLLVAFGTAALRIGRSRHKYTA